jgi:mannosyltransferase
VSWLVPFGSGETILRLPSALFGALTCSIIFGIGRALGGLRAGLLAGLLMALSPAQVQYGQEARSYALVTCMIVIGLWGQIALARDLSAASLPFRAPGASRRAWVIYLMGTVGAISVLSVALFWWLAANLAALFLAFRPPAKAWPFLRNWLIVQALIAMLVIPWFIAMYISVHGHMESGLDWVPPLRGRDVWSAISSVYLLRISSLITFHLFPQPLPWLGLAIAVLSVLGIVSLRRQRRGQLVVLAAAFLVLPVLLLVISLHTPIWMPRYLLWSAAPFFVLAGLGLTRMSPRMQTACLVVIGLLATANLAPYYHDDTKPRWDLAAAELHAELNEQDLLLVDDPTAVSLINLYLSRLGGDVILPDQWTLDVAAAATRLANGGKVWVVQGRVGQADKESMEAFLNRIAVLGPPALQLKKGRDVAMLRFDPQPEDGP